MRLGVHVPIAGGLLEAVARAKRLGCTTMQIFSRSPRGGRVVPIPQAQAEQFHHARRNAGIEPLAIHGPYIINLASPEPSRWRLFARLYQEEYARSALLQADYLVTHVGSHKGQGEEAGIVRVAQALTQALAHCRAPVKILLENTAGSGQGLGYRFEQLAAIRKQVKVKERVGICLDTAHLFAAGYALHTAEGLEGMIADFDRIIGLTHLKLIHLNDSKAPFDSRVDRHWHIGQGHIGLEAFRRIVNHPRLRDLPLILETPKTSEHEDQRNLAVVRGLVSHTRVSRGARAVVA